MKKDPLLHFRDASIARHFFQRAGIVLEQMTDDQKLDNLCRALSQIPYENLTKIIKNNSVIGAADAKRLPDEVIGDFLQFGTGGTCFSLTTACIAILQAAGFEAMPILADRHYGSDTHCALIFFHRNTLMLLDPGYLISSPCPLPQEEPLQVNNRFNTIELVPLANGQKVDLYTINKTNRKLRLTYKVVPVDGETFAKAWERSFAWEMMTYPVLTSCRNGTHQYMQGNILRERNGSANSKMTLSAQEQQQFITNSLGINAKISRQAFRYLNNG